MRPKRNCLVVGIMAGLFCTAPLRADDAGALDGTHGDDAVTEYVVTASRIPVPKKKVASSVTVVTGEEIREKGYRTVSDVLRDVPSVTVTQAGGPGKVSSAFIRGAKSEHTLVLIDGVEANDPISPGRTCDLSTLTADNIERIEIIKGPQSTIHGSDAIGGVIQIFTSSGSAKASDAGRGYAKASDAGRGFANTSEPNHGFASFETGSYSTFIERAGVRGNDGGTGYSLSVMRWDTSGLEQDGENSDYRNITLSGSITDDSLESQSFTFSFRAIDTESELGNTGVPGDLDPNNTGKSKQVFLRAAATLTCNDVWEQKLSVSLSDGKREYQNLPDEGHPLDQSESTYDGGLTQVAWLNTFRLEEKTITAGVETALEKGSSTYWSDGFFGPFSSIFEKEEVRTNSFFIEHIDETAFGSIGLGYRLDDNHSFKRKSTYRLSVKKDLSDRFSARGTWGTGVKAPTLFQLYSQYGNTGLLPEESRGWDLGVEYSLSSERLSVGCTWFSNVYENLIEYDFLTSTYENLSDATTEGLEFFLSRAFQNGATVRYSYTHLKTEDEVTGDDLLRRPQSASTLGFSTRPSAKNSLNLTVAYTGKRFDYDYSTWPAQRIRLSDYVLLNLSMHHQITDASSCFVRIENILDEEYEEVHGYESPGFSVYGGAKIRF